MIGGTIRKVISRGYYAFIRRDDANGINDIFVHGSALADAGLNVEDTGELVGTRVMFEIGQRSDGKLFATDVKKVEG